MTKKTIRIACEVKDHVPLDELEGFQGQLKDLSKQNYDRLKNEIVQTGFAFPVHVWQSPEGVSFIIGGHQRVRTLREMRDTEGYDIPPVPIVRIQAENQKQAKRRVLQDVAQYGTIEKQGLYEFMNEAELSMEELALDFKLPDINLEVFKAEYFEDTAGASSDGSSGSAPADRPTLADRFLVPPFSVLDARQGYWQERKDRWIAMGIKSELGRGGNASPGGSPRDAAKLGPDGKTVRGDGYGKAFTGGPGGPGGPAASMRRYQGQHVNGVLMKSDSGNDPTYYFKKQQKEKELGRTLTTEEFQRDYYEGPDSYESGTSIFDPVICELAYRWFCPPGGTILDPFAGGSVRGVVASKLGRQYVGMELREEQVEANRIQAAELCTDPQPVWNCNDSRNILDVCKDVQADFVFTCPPYADLEVYSDDERDLSTLGYPEFRKAYFEIMEKTCRLLKPNRFACVVVGEVRGGGSGAYYGFVQDTIAAFQAAGLEYYNEAILVTSVGSLAIRAARPFEASRKMGKTHQNVLVFVKGDPKEATGAVGPVEVAWPGDGAEALPDTETTGLAPGIAAAGVPAVGEP